MRRRAFLASLFATGLAGCGSLSDSDSTASISEPPDGWSGARGGPRKRGHTTLTYPTDGESTIDVSPGRTGIRGLTTPAVRGDEAVVPTGEAILGLHVQGFAERYSIPIDQYPTLPPTLGSTVTAFVTGRSVVGFDLQETTQAWSLPASRTSEYSAAPAALGDHSVIQDANRLRLVEQETGTVVWDREFDAYVRGFATDTETLALVRDAEDGSELVALDPADGNRKWSTQIESSRLHPVVDDHVYAVSEYGRLYAVEGGEVQGEVETELSNPGSIATNDTRVVVGPDDTDEYVGVSKAEASVVWRETVEFGSPPVVNSEEAFVPSANVGVVRLDAATGSRVETYEDARFADRLVPFDGGFLYLRRSDDRLAALRLGNP